MPLYSFNKFKIAKLPHAFYYNAYIERIPKRKLNRIISQIQDRIDRFVSCPIDQQTHRYIYIDKWSDEICKPLLDAFDNDTRRAEIILGAIIFQIFINRPENWAVRYSRNVREIDVADFFLLQRGKRADACPMIIYHNNFVFTKMRDISAMKDLLL